MSAEFSFKDRNALVFGGTSGINLGIAKAFARAGARVAVASRSQDKVNAAVEQLQALGSDALGYSLDVRDVEAVRAALESHTGHTGEIDVLISGAAGNFPALATGMSPNGFRSVVDIDLLGSFHVLHSAYPHLKKPGASIINVSAPQAFLAMPMQSHVCAAKAGVDMLTRTLALEWGPVGIRVNSITPGPIADTEGMKRLAPTEKIKESVKSTVPLQRYGSVEDIGTAAPVLYVRTQPPISAVSFFRSTAAGPWRAQVLRRWPWHNNASSSSSAGSLADS